MDECHFQIAWNTTAACSIEDLEKKSLKNLKDDCTIENPINGEIYNLTKLKNQDFIIKPPGTNEFYQFSICGPLANTNCSKGSGKLNYS